MYIHVLMRDAEGRKNEASKVLQCSKKISDLLMLYTHRVLYAIEHSWESPHTLL